MQALLESILDEVRPLIGLGNVADYIPALSRVPAAQFGIALRTCDGEEAQAGDSATTFSIQSISKLFALTLGMRAMGERLTRLDQELLLGWTMIWHTRSPMRPQT